MKYISLLLIFFLPLACAETKQNEIYSVLDTYMQATNEIDIEGVVGTYHFPHFRVAKGELAIWNTPQEAMPMLGMPRDKQLAIMRKALGAEWQRTEWGNRQIIASSENKAHVDTEMIRYNVEGKEMERVNSLYILAKKEGVWLIKGRSSFSAR